MMTADEIEMARNCYGYGSWDAPYWFVGPEQGFARTEDDSDFPLRVEAFRQTEKDGLSDCQAFHQMIPLAKWYRREKTPLQPTWKFLILFLKAFLDEDCGVESRRKYQRERWGRSAGETCVIELSGLAAKNMNAIRDRDSFRPMRLEFIHKKMCNAKPKIVVIYGKSQMKYWLEFWKSLGISAKQSENVAELEYTTVLFARQPTAPGEGNEYWRGLGRAMQARITN